jgi:preprotein translocase subunit SecB
MKASPIQTESIIYGEISVTPMMPQGDEAIQADGFDWDDVDMEIGIKHSVLKKENGVLAFPIMLRLSIPNGEDSLKKAPYSLSVSVIGGFAYHGDLPVEKATDIVVVNGLSILYSSLREMIINITSRMLHGPLYLPGANFMDHAPSKQPKLPPKAKKTPKRKADNP